MSKKPPLQNQRFKWWEHVTKLCSKFDCDMDLQSGKYYVDAKSIMGIFSLDLSKPLILNAGTEDEQKIKETFADFIGEE